MAIFVVALAGKSCPGCGSYKPIDKNKERCPQNCKTYKNQSFKCPRIK